MKKADVIIIGAGVLGCFMARALRRYDLSVQVFEKEPDICCGITRANTGIIYPGYDMAPGSLKARLTVRACREFPKLCETLGIRYQKCGSMMVGFGERAEAVIRKKYEQGKENGVSGLRLLSDTECLAQEPQLSPEVKIGLYAEGTCVVNPWDVCVAGYENAVQNGAVFAFDSKVAAIERVTEGFLVTVSGKTAEEKWHGRCVINCAGLWADKVHEMASDPSVRIRITGADYFLLDEADSKNIRHVIFHEPEIKGKGLTLVPTVDKRVMAGPTDRELSEEVFSDGLEKTTEKVDPEDGRARSAELRQTKQEGIAGLKDLCGEVVPSLETGHMIRSFGASRPNPCEVRQINGACEKTGRRMPDFNILSEDGFFSLVGIKTPGLTCCEQLGEYVSEQVIGFLEKPSDNGEQALRKVRKNSDYDPARVAPVTVHEMSLSQRAEVIASDPSYGHVICSCQDVTEGEIREAVRRGAKTLDGLKIRTGVFMGRCQGSRCLQKVLEIMASELGCRPEEIVKNRPDSRILY